MGRGRVAAVVLGASALAGAGLVTSASPVSAHGGMTFPATRTYACYVDGLAGGGGDLNPSNPACAEAIARGGKQPLWDWFGNLISDVGDRHREVVADGKLCGPTEKYDAYNMARSDWPTTDVRPGATVTFRYNAWAAHPGTWSQYVTKDGWDPSRPLRWSDLEPVPFDEVVNPSINGEGPHGAEYTWQAELPNKSGRHIIYSVWERSDSPEAFYNCSDVNFTGSAPAQPGAPTTPPTTTPPTTTPPAPTTTTTVAPAPAPTTPTTAAPAPAPSRPDPGQGSGFTAFRQWILRLFASWGARGGA